MPKAVRPRCTAEPIHRQTLSVQFSPTSASLPCRYMPNTPLAVAWIEAAKRLGVPFVAVAAGTASSTLADRQAGPVSTQHAFHTQLRVRALCCAGWRTRAHPCS